jgi:hypothetical protein
MSSDIFANSRSRRSRAFVSVCLLVAALLIKKDARKRLASHHSSFAPPVNPNRNFLASAKEEIFDVEFTAIGATLAPDPPSHVLIFPETNY